MAAKKLKIAVGDIETDPFEYGAEIKPFAAGLYLASGEYHRFWGNDCVPQFLTCADKVARGHKIYFHNGGKFDFNFFLEHLDDREVTIINNRIVKAYIDDILYIDSYPLIPEALENYQKTKIDYEKFKRDKRERNKQEILRYLFDDCRYLFELVTGFIEAVGDHLTIGSASFALMRDLGYELPRCGSSHDAKFRPFFYGGRCEAFHKGELKNFDGHYYDINSMYPALMRLKHPVGTHYDFSKSLDAVKETPQSFAHITAKSHGALPTRTKKGLSYNYDTEYREYWATGWEIVAGLETETLDIDRVLAVHVPQSTVSFQKFVDECFALRQQAKAAGDRISELAHKRRANSGYGKFATNPEHFKDYCFVPIGEFMAEPWEPEQDYTRHGVTLWSKPGKRIEESYFDVATSASITGAGRAQLLRVLAKAPNKLYCDTDSIVHNGPLDLDLGKGLGQWDLEERFDYWACGGKKMYTLRAIDGTWKTASKGVRLGKDAIIDVARGKTVNFKNPFPTFQRGEAKYIARDVKMT